MRQSSILVLVLALVALFGLAQAADSAKSENWDKWWNSSQCRLYEGDDCTYCCKHFDKVGVVKHSSFMDLCYCNKPEN